MKTWFVELHKEFLPFQAITMYLPLQSKITWLSWPKIILVLTSHAYLLSLLHILKLINLVCIIIFLQSLIFSNYSSLTTISWYIKICAYFFQHQSFRVVKFLQYSTWFSIMIRCNRLKHFVRNQELERKRKGKFFIK